MIKHLPGRVLGAALVLLALVFINYITATRQVYAASCVSQPTAASISLSLKSQG